MPTKRGAKPKRGVKAKAKVKSDGPDSLQKTCPGCGGSKVIFDALMAQIVCHECGQMYEELPEEIKRDQKTA